ncbi:MAG: sugar phosphate isomerase/epimerase [Oscillospiraceae bacterium]|nr:sugar phosphate isomerase/epimerase [Oscillospiraceae bacterium]
MAKFIVSAFADEASGGILHQIEACKKNNITHIELRGLGDGKSINSTTPDEAQDLKKILDGAGIGVSAIGSGYGKIKVTDDFEPHFEAFKNTVEVACVLGTKNIRMFSFYFTDIENYADCKDEAFRRVEALCDYSLKSGIKCCHENERGIYGDIPERCLELHQALGSKLGGVFDPANYILDGVEILPAYDMLAEYIDYMHVKDARFSDRAITPAGMGDANFAELLKRFAQKDGERFLTIEPHLKVFEGLKELEADGGTASQLENRRDFSYATRDDSFKAAADALHTLLLNL